MLDQPTVTDPSPHDPTAQLLIMPWVDPLVDDNGHDPRSRYVEQFWLGVLGPTATWFVRRVAAVLDEHPEGTLLDLHHTAASMGLSYHPTKPTPFSRAMHRCVMFGVAHQITNGLAVRRRLPAVATRHLRRLPDDVRNHHESWHTTQVSLDELGRAHEVARALLNAGDDPQLVEHRLVAIGVSTQTAALVGANALELAAHD